MTRSSACVLQQDERPCHLVRAFRKRSENEVCDYFPPKINQSPCEVPMNSNIGSDSQAFAREAMKACRASSGAAGGPPCKPAIIRLFAGQIMPQTLSSMMMPSAPPTPIDSDLLLAKC